MPNSAVKPVSGDWLTCLVSLEDLSENWTAFFLLFVIIVIEELWFFLQAFSEELKKFANASGGSSSTQSQGMEYPIMYKITI